MEERFDGKGALRDVGGVLEQGDITGREGRGSETEELPVWEIPGHDGENGAEGFVADEAVDFGVPGRGPDGRHRFVGEKCGCNFSEVTTGERAFLYFLNGGADWFTHFEGDGAGMFVLLGEKEIGEAEHEAGAICDGCVAPGSVV